MGQPLKAQHAQKPWKHASYDGIADALVTSPSGCHTGSTHHMRGAASAQPSLAARAAGSADEPAPALASQASGQSKTAGQLCGDGCPVAYGNGRAATGSGSVRSRMVGQKATIRVIRRRLGSPVGTQPRPGICRAAAQATVRERAAARRRAEACGGAGVVCGARAYMRSVVCVWGV